MKSTAKKTIVIILAFVFMIALMTAVAVMVTGKNATTSSMTVTSLDDLYDDSTRAKEDLDAMRGAGLIDEQGKMVDLDLRVNGESVELTALASRIANGEEVGDITVNGNVATAEQVVKIAQVNAAIEIAELLNEEINVTDKHVSNLEALLASIQSGSIDLEATLKTGALRLSGNALKGTENEDTTDYTLPENTPAKLTLNEKGDKYYAPYVSGSTYIKKYAFDLNPDAENNDTYVTGYTGAKPQPNTATTEGNVRVDGFDWENAIVGVDDNAGFPTVTVLLPFKTDDSIQNLIASDASDGKITDITVNGVGVQMDLPRYGSCNLKYYFNYMYFEYDGSAQLRLPVYIVEAVVGGLERAVAVATRFVAPVNNNTYARLDTLSLHVDREGSINGPTVVTYEQRYMWGGYDENWNPIEAWRTNSVVYPYLAPWSEISTDIGGNYYWNMTAYAPKVKVEGDATFPVRNLQPSNAWSTWVEHAPAIPGRCLRYFVQPLMQISTDKYQIREEGSWEQAKNGFIRLLNPENPEFPYVYPVDTQHPERQYDVETMLTEELYNAYAKEEAKSSNLVSFDCLSKDLVFENDPVYPWYVAEARGGWDGEPGTYYVRNGNWAFYPNNNKSKSQSVLSLEVSLEEAGTLSFEHKYDFFDSIWEANRTYCELKVDNKIELKVEGSTIQWQPVSIDLSIGHHKISWIVTDGWLSDTEYLLKNVSINTEGCVKQTRPEEFEDRFDSLLEGYTFNTQLYIDSVYKFIDGVYVHWMDKDSEFNWFEETEGDRTYVRSSRKLAYGEEEGDVSLELSVTLTEPGVVSFDHKYFRENKYFACSFSVDHHTVFFPEVGKSSTWENYSYNLPVGSHTLTWYFVYNYYDSDESGNVPSENESFYAIDNIVFTTEGEVYQGKLLQARSRQGDENLRVALRISDRLNFSKDINGDILKKLEWSDRFTNGRAPDYVIEQSVENGVFVGTIFPTNPTETGCYFTNANLLGYKGTPIYGTAFDLKIPIYLRICDAEPFFTVPKSSQIRQAIVGNDADIMFSSNLAQHNKLEGGTKYNVELYKIGGIDKDDLNTLPQNAQKINVSDWGEFPASKTNVVTHFTVPGSAIDQAGWYAVTISAQFSDGEKETQTFFAIAYLNAKNAPVKVNLGEIANTYVDTDHIPAITYTLKGAAADVEVKYTVQPSGEAVSAMTDVTGGVIPFAPDAFEGLRKAYTITVYARNSANDPWSVDSMLLTVYNNEVLKILIKDIALGQIGGSTGGKAENGAEEASGSVNIDNNPKIVDLIDDSGEGAGITISGYDLDALRADVGLQRVISVNYGSGVWGTISDRMQWSSKEADGTDSRDVTLNYKENGSYHNAYGSMYNSFVPTTDFMIVATDDKSEDAPVTITAVHALSGTTRSINVTVNTLKDKLYLFRFMPKATTYVTYTNGKGVVRELHSNTNGELIVYDPDGIASDIITMSESNGDTYVGTIQNKNIVSGEKNIALMQLYPCNNLTLQPISNHTLTVLKADGKPYTGSAILRVGIYKGGEYCPTFGVRTTKDEGNQIVRNDVNVSVKNGKVTLYYDPTQITADDGLKKGIFYAYEYRIEGYQPGYLIVDPFSKDPASSMINLQKVRGNATSPQIIRQEYQQYFNGTEPTSYIRNVIDSTDNIGISPNFPKAVLYTDIALPGERVRIDGTTGYSAYDGNNVVKFAFYTTSGKKLTGQTDLSGESVQAEQITNLYQLNDATYFVFPFSTMPFLRSTYVMTDADMRADGMDDTAKTPTARVKAVFTRGALTVANINMPFGVTNVSNQPDLLDSEKGAGMIGQEVRDKLDETTDIGAIFRSIDVNDMIRQGFIFLGNLEGEGGDNFVHLVILPTQDPAVFRIVAFVSADKRPEDDDEDGISANFNPNDLAEDVENLKKQLEESTKKKDSDSDGEGKMEFNFYGTVILEARVGVADGKWDISFRGGNVGTNVSGKYEWGQTFMCGPYPAFISFETGFHADLEVAFGNKDSARAMLLDASLGVSIEAFAGLGFDMSIVAIQLGIYGSIGADVNFLLLTPSDAAPSTGTQLTIAGEIGIKLKVKLLFISYSQKYASTGFDWTKKWNKYDYIKDYWTDQGYGQLFGLTKSGRAYKMLLFADGSAAVAIDGGAELESRDYLELEERVWSSGLASGRRLFRAASSMTDVQTNAYPYSDPVFTDDGELFLYISDNDNAEKAEGVASYAVKNGEGYVNMERIDTSEDNILADLDVVASGTKDNAFAAWVKQLETPKIAFATDITNDDLGMMFNATEVYASFYNGTAWTTTRLTDNYVADMSPSVASYGNKAIVAWRSMNASSMTANGDITAAFDVENNINYRIYNGAEWTTASVAYNGSAGSVNALDSAMLPDGTAVLTYTVRTGDDVTTTETFYTVIDANGNLLTTGRLTNDDYTDTNAKAVAVNENGGYFLIGWYSEHDAGEGTTTEYDHNGNATQKAVVAHDIRLARINANGSYSLDFPESIGGTGNTGISSDFRFSSPVHNTDLTNVSIVWSQRKDSDLASDAGKYELNAVRFFKANSVIGVTAPTSIAETNKNYTIDHFDVYTDSEGAIHAVILGSDYDNIQGIEVYDSIDLDAAANNTVDSSSDAPNHLDILDGEAISSIKLAKGAFPEIAADVTVQTNIDDVVPGLTMPIQFTVTNTGTDKLTSITATVGTANPESKDFTVDLLPNQSATLLMTYSLPEGAVNDLDYSVTSSGVELGSGTITINRPDVGISSVKLIREENGERDIQVRLNNSSNIPLDGSGKIVKLAFYKDVFHKNRIGEEISVSAENYADIDRGIYTIVHTIAVTDLYSGGGEIPDVGLTVYVRAWVDETEEPTTTNNASFVYFKGLVARNGEIVTTDTSLEENGGNYIVYAEIRNNSIFESNVGIPVAILVDVDGNIVARKNFQDTELILGKESLADDLSVTFTASEIQGIPAAAEVRRNVRVSFDVNGGTGEYADVYTDIDGHIVLPENDPTPSHNVPALFFRGWYTDPTGGEMITKDYFFEVKTTVYARYSIHEHVFEYTVSNNGATIIAECISTVNDDCTIEDRDRTVTLTIVAPERAANGYGMPNATIVGDKDVLGTPIIRYYTVDGAGLKGNEWSEAPLYPGKYLAEFTISDKKESVTAYVAYEIPAVEGVDLSYVTIPDFVKITDIAELDSIDTCSQIEAMAWFYGNEERMKENGDVYAKYIVYDYDADMTSVSCVFKERHVNGCNRITVTLEELRTKYADGSAEIYVLGSGSIELVSDANFERVSGESELSSIRSCTTLDALIWIITNTDDTPSCFVAYSKYENNNLYNLIRYDSEKKTISFDTGSPWYLFEANKLPVYTVPSSEVISPYLTYTVTYDRNGGTGSNSGKFYVKSHIELASDDGFSQDYFVFEGWNTKANGKGDAYRPGDAFEVLGDTVFYAQWKHVHDWSISYDESTHTFTARCNYWNCPIRDLTLHSEVSDKMYDGESVSCYTCSKAWTAENGLPIPTVTFRKNGEVVSEAKNVGTYTAMVSLDGHDDDLGEFTISQRPIIVSADDKEIYERQEEPDLTVTYSAIGSIMHFENDTVYPWSTGTDGERVYAKSGNGGAGDSSSTLKLNVTLTKAGKLSFDYKYGTENDCDLCYFILDGTELFSVSGSSDWKTFTRDLTAGDHSIKWVYTKDIGGDDNGDFFAVDNVLIETDGTVTERKLTVPEGSAPIPSLINNLYFNNDADIPWEEVNEDGRSYLKPGNICWSDTSSALSLFITLEKEGTVSFEYKYFTESADACQFKVDNNVLLEVSGDDNNPEWQWFSCNLAAGSHILTWTYTKDAYDDVDGEIVAIDNLGISTEGAITQVPAEDPEKAAALNNAVNRFDGGIVKGETLNYTISRQAGNTKGTYAITLTMGDNPNYDIKKVQNGTFTILESLGEPQVIEASDVTATYGDAGVKINATVTKGDGTLSYKVKSGDAVTVDAEGNLTIVKAGTAVIIVTASKTDTYAITDKKINVTINPKNMTVSANDVNVLVDGQRHGITVTVTDPQEGYTVKYGTEEGTYDLVSSPYSTNEGTLVVYYQVTADNYVTFTGSATITLIRHTHVLTYTVGTGDNANTIIATCSADNCYFPGSKATLTISVPGTNIVYDGKSHSAIITDANGIKGNAKVLYSIKGADGVYGETFATAPVNVGTYRASITLGSGENSATVSVEYEITNATLTNVGVVQKGTLVYNGDAQTPQVTTSATAVNHQTVTFVYSLTENGEYGEMPSFTLVADSGTVYFKASADNHDEVTGSFTVTVSKANQVAPIAPILDTATANMIKLMAEYGCEYSMNGTTWQDSVVFTGLTKGTEYTFYQRLKETANYNASPLSEAAIIFTEDHNHEWNNFSGNGAVITAICDNTDGGHTGDASATMTIVAPTMNVYGGTGSAEATVINNIDGIDTPTIVYKQGNTVLSAAPTDAGTYTASITLNGATASVSYTIAKTTLTITANSHTITYGDAPTDNGVLYDGFAQGETESVLSGTLDYDYSYTQYGNVGTYTITPKGLESGNYEITFVSGVFAVEPKQITVTIDNKNSVYGDDPVLLSATSDGIVNNDTGVYSLDCKVTKTSAVGTYDINGTDTSDNYIVTFANEQNAYSVTKKALTVTANRSTVTYGDMPEDADVSFEGLVNNEDRSVLGGELKFTYNYEQFDDVGEYIITPNGLTSDNYEITFATGVLTVTKKALIVTANPHAVTYGDRPEAADVSFEGFVGGDDRTVLGGEIEFAYNYEQFDDVGAYAIIPSGYTSGNYEITFESGVLTVLPKEITVTIVPKTSIYGEPQVELEATTEEGAVVNGDTDLYSLACEVSGTSVVGLYDIVGSDLSDNYAITFAGEKDAYSVTKRPITATAEDKTIKYGDALPMYTFTVSEEIAKDVLAELQSKTSFACDGNSLVPGKYEIALSFIDGIRSDNALTNYTVTLENADLYVLAKVLADTSSEVGSAVEILLGNSDDAFDYGISVEIGAVDSGAQDSSLNYGAIQKQYVNRRSEISKVYSIKLFRTVTINGEQVTEEIQPSDIKEGLTVFVKMEIPAYLAGRNFRILHIHSADDIEYVPEENVEIKDGYVIVKVDRFSEFAFVHLKACEEIDHAGFCLGRLVIIFDVLVVAFFAVYMLLKRKKLLNIIGLGVSGAVAVFALIVLILHICYASIIGFILAVLLVAAFLTFFFIGRKGGNGESAKTEDQISVQKEASVVTEETDVAATQIKRENIVEEDEEEEGGVIMDASGNIFNIRYNKSFTAKLIQLDEEAKGYYGELKNEALSYSKTKSRVSWAYDSVNAGRAPVVKFGIRGKTLCVYLPLNAEKLDEKYKVETVEAAKYAAVPCMYRIKNERRLRYAKELIAKVCESLGLTKGDLRKEDYYLPYERTEELFAKGLIKELKTRATATRIEQAKVAGAIPVKDRVSAAEVNGMITNEVALSAIITESKAAVTGKRSTINVDVLSASFNDGDTVTVESLKAKKLVPASTKQVKLLARGTLNKVLHVELQDYSLEAVKMIIATGGTVKKV